MSEHGRSRRRAVTLVVLGLGAVVVLAAIAVVTVVLTGALVDEERRAAPTLPIAVPTDSAAPRDSTATVVDVVAGDKVVVDDGAQRVTVRIASIDAPDVDTDQCWSKEARSFAERLLADEEVTLGGAPVAENAAVSVRLSDGTDFATAAVEAGMARAIASIDLTTAEQRARTEGAGLWGDYCEGQVYAPIDGPAQSSTSAPPTT